MRDDPKKRPRRVEERKSQPSKPSHDLVFDNEHIYRKAEHEIANSVRKPVIDFMESVHELVLHKLCFRLRQNQL